MRTALFAVQLQDLVTSQGLGVVALTSVFLPSFPTGFIDGLLAIAVCQLIFLFSSSVSTGLGGFSLIDLLVLLLSYPNGLGGFIPIMCPRSFGFLLQLHFGVRSFLANLSLGFPPWFSTRLGGFLPTDLSIFLRSFPVGFERFSPIPEAGFFNRLSLTQTRHTISYNYNVASLWGAVTT